MNAMEEKSVATKSAIEWTEQTWNPVTGCTKVSPGCKNCYAETMAMRLKAMGAKGYENGFQIQLRPEKLQEPLKRKKPTVYFVNSMSDLFHESVPDSFIDEAFRVMAEAKQHTFQLLTKRAARLASYFETRDLSDNVWLGVSVEDQQYGVPRIDELRKVNAAIRFLSVEPLLEDLGQIDLTDIHWVIVGGESGARARPMQQSWVESIQSQCESAGAAFFFKQWGGWGADGVRRHKKTNGRELNGRTWDEYPLISSVSL